jgi:hypothetical protein
MRYNKLFQYEKSGIQKRSVTVTDDLKVETKLIPRFGLPLLVKELSTVVNKNEYKRVNPYKFDTTTDRHVYILYAEPRDNGYEIIRKLIIRQTHKGNFKIPEGTYLYDVLDYFVEIGLLDENYNFIGEVKENIGISTIELVDKDLLISYGFNFPGINRERKQQEKYIKVITPLQECPRGRILHVTHIQDNGTVIGLNANNANDWTRYYIPVSAYEFIDDETLSKLSFGDKRFKQEVL